MINSQLSLIPLGAGDLIDRAIRLYRRNFFTLIRISAPPVLVSAVGTVLWTLGWHEIFSTGKEAAFAFYALLMTFGALLWMIGSLMTLMVMGGAARNLVRHLLWNEPITLRETYRSMRQRFFGLLAATSIIGLILLFTFWGILYGLAIVLAVLMLGAALLAATSPILAVIVGVIVGAAATFFALWLFFLIAVRFACVPQVMLVEGQGVFDAIGRSASLASGNVKRFAALILFTLFATYSSLMVLLLPFLWYGQANGIPFFSFEPNAQPVWYSITLQVIWQLSLILLAPVWMLGLSLLYVDSRVRHEAYDVELMAARQLGEMPALAPQYVNPLRPALVSVQSLPFEPNQRSSKITTLGLN